MIIDNYLFSCYVLCVFCVPGENVMCQKDTDGIQELQKSKDTEIARIGDALFRIRGKQQSPRNTGKSNKRGFYTSSHAIVEAMDREK